VSAAEVAMASEVLINISRDEVEQAWLRSREKYELDTQSDLTYAREEIINLLKSGKSPEEILKGYE
jgi:hypothetical protein